MIIAERVKHFMELHELSRDEMAEILRTPVSTVNDWLSATKPRIPPACMVLIMNLLEQSPQARKLAGVHKTQPRAPRGKPFKPGNPYRYKKDRAL